LPRDPQIADAVADLASRTSDRMDTRVRADGFASATSRGRLIVECADLEDLRRIVDIIAGD
jgi:hypothetical protein